MSPLPSPSPYLDPEEPLGSSSITLGNSGIHEKAMSSVVAVASGPSSASKSREGERIAVTAVDLYPSEPNGAVRMKACCGKAVRLLKAFIAGGGVVVKVISGASTPNRGVGVGGETALAEDGSVSGGGGGGTCSFPNPNPNPATKAAKFDEALSALRSLSSSVCVEAGVDRDVKETFGEMLTNLKNLGFLGEDGEEGDQVEGDDGDVDEAEGEGLKSGIVLINVRNDLGGDGTGYIEMQVVEDNDQNKLDQDVCHCGSRF